MYDKNKEINRRKEAVHMAKEIRHKKNREWRQEKEMREVRKMA